MAEEIKNDIMGVSASIHADEVKKGADEFIEQTQRMSKSAEQTAEKVRSLEEQLIRLRKESEALRSKSNIASQKVGKLEQSGNTYSTSYKDARREEDKALKEWQKKQSEINKTQEELANQQAELEKTLNESSKTSTGTINTRLRKLTQEVADLTLQWRDMSAEERKSAQGQEILNKFQLARKEASKLKDAMADARQIIAAGASDTSEFDAVIGGLQTMTSLYGLAASSAQLFGMSEEDVAETQANLQAVMTATMSLQEIKNQLQKESALMQGIQNIQMKAGVIALELETAAKGKNIIVTKLATAAQAAFNKVASMNPYVVLAMAIAAVTSAVIAYTAYAKKAKEEEEARNRELEKQKEEQERIAEEHKKVGSSIGDLVAKYQILRSQYKLLKTDAEKNDWIKANQSAFDGLGVSINNVNDAQRVFIENSGKMIRALSAIAEAEAFKSIFQSKVSDLYEFEQQSHGYTKARSKDDLTDEEKSTFYHAKYNKTTGQYEGLEYDIDAVNRAREKEAYDQYQKEHAAKTAEVGKARQAMEQGIAKSMQAQSEISSFGSISQSGNNQTSNKEYNALKEKRDLYALQLESLEEYSQEWLLKYKELANTEYQIDVLNKQQQVNELLKTNSNKKEIQDAFDAWKLARQEKLNQDIYQAEAEAGDKINEELEKRRAKELKDFQDKQKKKQEALQAEWEYYQKYGNLEQQQQAIISDYDNRISQEQDPYRKKILEKEKESALNDISLERIKGSVDWEALTGQMDKLSKGKLLEQSDKLSTSLKTDTSLTAEGKKVTGDMIEQINQEIKSRNPFSKALDAWKTQNPMEISGLVSSNVSSLPSTLQSLGVDQDSEFYKRSEALATSMQGFENAAKSLASGDFIGAIGSFADGLGGLGDVFGISESDPELKSDLERLAETNENLQLAVENLTKEMEDATLGESVEIYARMIQNINDQIANTQESMARSAAAYKDGFLGIGGDHSSNYEINNSMSAADWIRVSEAAGVAVNGASDFWNLTSEQMYKVATYASTQYDKIKQAANDGYMDAAQYMDEYIQYWEQLEKYEDEYINKMTGLSFGSMQSDFKNACSNMEATAYSMGDSIEDAIRSSISNSLMVNTYNEKIKELTKNMAEAIKSDGGYSEAEVNSIKSQWIELGKAYNEELESMYEALGLDVDANVEASRKSIANISQDTADSIDGRLTNIDYQVTLRSQLETQNQATLQVMQGELVNIGAYMASQNQMISEVRDIQLESVGYLSGIEKNTRPLTEINDSIKEIRDKVNYL